MLSDSNEMICFLVYDATIEEHYYHCYKIAVGLDGTFSTCLNNETFPTVSGYILSSNVTHSCRAPSTGTLVYFIEIESRIGAAVRKLLNNKAFVLLPNELITPTVRQLLTLFTYPSPDRLDELAQEILFMLLPTLRSQQLPVFDQRIEQIIDYVDQHIQHPLAIADVANQIHLSPERTRHLFEEQIGAPFTQFVLWKRIKSVIFSVLSNQMGLAQAANQFGFADQSHFNRLFKRMFGTTPAYFLKVNPYVRFIRPSLVKEKKLFPDDYLNETSQFSQRQKK